MLYVLLTDTDHEPVKFMKGSESCTGYTEIVFSNRSIIVEESLYKITNDILPRYHKMSWDSALSADVILRYCREHFLENCERNKDLRAYAKEKGVKLWQIAKAMGISEPTITRKLRSELPEQDKLAIKRIILELSNSKFKEEK